MIGFWERINDEKVPKYFTEICENYGFRMVKVDEIHTALAKEQYAIVIGMDRFSATVDYIMRCPLGEYKMYHCQDFFRRKYDADDRAYGKDISELIERDLAVISHGLVSKWENVLLGDISWIAEMKKGSAMCEVELPAEPLEKPVKRYFDKYLEQYRHKRYY